MKHKNATAGGSTGLAVLVVVLILARLDITLDPAVATVIAGGAITAVLFIGRNGFEGVWNLLKHGTGKGKP